MIRGCVIGAGRMGRVHIQALTDLGVEVVGVSDISEDSLLAARDEHRIAGERLYRNADQMLAETSPELVAIATTTPSHHEYAVLAIAAGARYLVCEKPLCASVATAGELVALADERGVVFAVNHQMRFMDQYSRVKALLDSGRFGRLTSMNVLGGNFGIAMNGSHYFEAFRYLTGEGLSEVWAWFDESELPNARGPEFRDRSGSIRGHNPSGSRFHLDASADQGHGMAVHYGTETGQIHVNEFDGIIRYVHREPEHAEAPSTRYGMPWVAGESSFPPADNLGPTRAVCEAALRGNGFPDARVGLAVVRVLAAAHLSDELNGARMLINSDEIDVNRLFPWA